MPFTLDKIKEKYTAAILETAFNNFFESQIYKFRFIKVQCIKFEFI